ncbi:MAG: hypothetical protein K2Z81_05425, partial [Cyanobacteria bacterium]|nr:hypothetical protein [Cyanobacteriota bacterium]
MSRLKRLILFGLIFSLVGTAPALAQFVPGQFVYIKYVGQWREARVVRQDSSGVLVEWRNALTGIFDNSGTAYYLPDQLTATKPADFNESGYGNSQGALRPAGGGIPGAAGVSAATGAVGTVSGAEAGITGATPAGTASTTPQADSGVGQYIHHPQPQNPNQVNHQGGTPRIGRYILRAFSSSYSYQPQNTVGWFDLFSNNTYKTQSGGTGTYRLGGEGIEWLSGPYKENNFLGVVRLDRDGLTSRVT